MGERWCCPQRVTAMFVTRRVAALQADNAALRAENAALLAELEGFRAAKRQQDEAERKWAAQFDAMMSYTGAPVPAGGEG